MLRVWGAQFCEDESSKLFLFTWLNSTESGEGRGRRYLSLGIGKLIWLNVKYMGYVINNYKRIKEYIKNG